MRIKDSRWKVDRVMGEIRQGDEGDGSTVELEGGVQTPHGFVMVYAFGDMSIFRFVWRGINHTRKLDGQTLTRRGLAMLAGRFARAVAGEKE